MSIQLTEDQSKAIEQATETPPIATDPRTKKSYRLISQDAFERVKSLVDATAETLTDTYRAQIDSAMRAGWNDPEMDDYNDYDAHRKS